VWSDEQLTVTMDYAALWRVDARHVSSERWLVPDSIQALIARNPTTFRQTNLISDGSVAAQTTDPNPINPRRVGQDENGELGSCLVAGVAQSGPADLPSDPRHRGAAISTGS
jgi:hypothetical protein